nr:MULTISPECIES: hypothetical protein [unclassified Actinoplanes]
MALGYVLGSRAGREKYEQIVAAARKARTHPTVTQAQQKAKDLLHAASVESAAGTDAQPTQVTSPAKLTASATPAARPTRRKPTKISAVSTTGTDPLA